MTEVEVRAFLKRYFGTVFDAPEVSAFTDLFAPDGVLEDPVGVQTLRGREAIGQFITAARPVVERAECEIREVFPCGHESAVRWTFTLTTRRGARLQIEGLGIFSFDDQHRLRHVREFYDASHLQKLFAP